MQKLKVAVIDDELSICEMLSIYLESKGYNVSYFVDSRQAVEAIKREDFHIYIVDLMMPNLSGIDLLRKIKEKSDLNEVILISAFGTVDRVREAFKFHAFDFIEKPFEMTHLEKIVNEAAEKVKRKIQLEKKEKDIVNDKIDLGDFELIGEHYSIKNIIEKAKRIAKYDTTVLITGETGTGKEEIANLIYKYSDRYGKPFIKVNCPAVALSLFESELFGYEKGAFTGAYKSTPGKFQAADGGVIFLDEIGDLPLEAQAKILRIIQHGELTPVGSTETIKIDVRIIAATNVDLATLVKEGKFREDLYYRLNQVRLHLPPLRERGEDVKLLIDYFNKYYAKKYNKPLKEIPGDILQLLLTYNWPGNIRELSNVINRFYVLSDDKKVAYSDIPSEILIKEDIYKEEKFLPSMEELEKSYIYYLLNREMNNKKKVAEILGVDLSTLYRKINRYGLDKISNYQEYEFFVNKNLKVIEKAIIFYYIEYEKLSLDELSDVLKVDKKYLKGKLYEYGYISKNNEENKF